MRLGIRALAHALTFLPFVNPFLFYACYIVNKFSLFDLIIRLTSQYSSLQSILLIISYFSHALLPDNTLETYEMAILTERSEGWIKAICSDLRCFSSTNKLPNRHYSKILADRYMAIGRTFQDEENRRLLLIRRSKTSVMPSAHGQRTRFAATKPFHQVPLLPNNVRSVCLTFVVWHVRGFGSDNVA